MTETKSNNGLKAIAGLLLFGMIALAIFTYTLYQDKQKTQKSLEQERDLVVEDLNSLKSEYDKAIIESNVTSEELIAARDNIAKYIDSVRNMKTEISTLYRYRRQVNQLREEREILLRRVDSLTQSNTLLAMQRDSTFMELEKQTVFNDSLVVQNTELAAAVERGSALNLAQFTIDAVKERSSGKLVSTQRAKQTDKFKVCFTVAENAIASSGDREFYIEVLDPQGNPMGISATKTNSNGRSVTYTKSTKFYYENNSLDVCDYIQKPADEFQKGNYMVNVYDDTLKLLSTSRFELK